jgi:urea transport system substrate-binding protein
MTSRLLLASLALAAALSPAMAADPIRIGVPVGLSGANSVVAPSVVQSAELAVEEINAKGGVLGRPLALDVADDVRAPPAPKRRSTHSSFRRGSMY